MRGEYYVLEGHLNIKEEGFTLEVSMTKLKDTKSNMFLSLPDIGGPMAPLTHLVMTALQFSRVQFRSEQHF